MRELIESLLEMTVCDAAGQENFLEPTNLRDIAAEQIALIGPLAAEKRIAISADLESAPCLTNAEQIAASR